MDYEVRFMEVGSRRAAVVAAATTWQDFPALRDRIGQAPDEAQGV